VKIAVCQESGPAGDVAGAIARIRHRALTAAAAKAALAIFPEMYLTGYNIGDAVFSLAEPADGPSAAAVDTIARDTGVSILYGYPERSGDRVFNSTRLVHPGRGALANYRKTHLYGGEEKRLFAPGDDLVLADLDGLKVGLLICYDVEFPEAVRALALAGAELIAVPTALIQPFDIAARTLVPARAFENQVYVAYAGLCGREGNLSYCGLSCIVGPDGRDLARAGTEPALLIADIDSSAITDGRQANPYLADRRPELYDSPVKQATSLSAKGWGPHSRKRFAACHSS
jgi:predicted amidohydrolase